MKAWKMPSWVGVAPQGLDLGSAQPLPQLILGPLSNSTCLREMLTRAREGYNKQRYSDKHVILFLSDMHIEVSHMHFWHADRRCWMHVGHHIVKSKIMTNMGMLFLFDSQTWSCVSQHTHEGGCLKGLWCLLWSKTTQYMRRCFASAGTRCTQRVDCPWGCSRLLKRVSVTAVSGAARGSAACATSG